MNDDEYGWPEPPTPQSPPMPQPRHRLIEQHQQQQESHISWPTPPARRRRVSPRPASITTVTERVNLEIADSVLGFAFE